jgi:hypothetical protein
VGLLGKPNTACKHIHGICDSICSPKFWVSVKSKETTEIADASTAGRRPECIAGHKININNPSLPQRDKSG